MHWHGEVVRQPGARDGSVAPKQLRGQGVASAVGLRLKCEGRAKKKKPQTHVHLPDRASKKYLPTFFSFFFFFSKKFLLRFCVFLGMGNPETAKNLFWKFFGHDPKVHHMTQKNIFFRYLFCTFLAILRPLQTPLAPGGTSKPLKSAWGVFLRKSKIHPKSAFSAGGGKGALAARGSHMRLVSTK